MLSDMAIAALVDVLPRDHDRFDVCIYRATPGGIAAALSAAFMNASVLMLEPSQHLGGMMTEGGIGMRDIPVEFIPTDSRDTFVQWGMLNGEYYGKIEPIWQPDNWIGEASLWKMLKRFPSSQPPLLGVDIQEGSQGLIRKNKSIVGLKLNNVDETTVHCKVVIDASYEGDILLAANGSYAVGRESNTTYDESLAGITNHSDAQFQVTIDPFIDDENNRTLISFVQSAPNPLTQIGRDDNNVMAYSYRVCWTKDPYNKVAVPKPTKYNPDDFEVARRYIQDQLAANQTISYPWSNLVYRSYDKITANNTLAKLDACCGLGAVGIDVPGLGKEYPLASRTERKAIADRHRYYVQGLMWFWQNDEVVPLETRKEFNTWGLCRDEWPDNGHFPRQLYVREAIRMVGDRVFTQHDHNKKCRRDSIGYGSWEIDIHDVQRVAVQNDENEGEWSVMNEGENYATHDDDGFFVFDLPYWMLVPKRDEFDNLLVVNAPSVSHVAFAALRVEPTLWHLGIAAGTAATLAASYDVAVQDVDISQLQAALKHQGVMIHGPRNCTTGNVHHYYHTEVVR
jgi:hypothetical protein